MPVNFLGYFVGIGGGRVNRLSLGLYPERKRNQQ